MAPCALLAFLPYCIKRFFSPKRKFLVYSESERESLSEVRLAAIQKTVLWIAALFVEQTIYPI